jgi:hypothetical protein
VPGEATIVELNEDGSPDGGSERLVPARDVGVGTNVFVRAGQQVSDCDYSSDLFFWFFWCLARMPPLVFVGEDDFRRNLPRRE